MKDDEIEILIRMRRDGKEQYMQRIVTFAELKNVGCEGFCHIAAGTADAFYRVAQNVIPVAEPNAGNQR